MLPKKRVPTHPGEVLNEEFLQPLGVTQVALAAHLGVPVQRINELVRGKRGVTPETAWLLASSQAVSGVTPRLPRTSSLIRWTGTPRCAARATWVTPSGWRNSSFSTSPGWVGTRFFGSIRTPQW